MVCTHYSLINNDGIYVANWLAFYIFYASQATIFNLWPVTKFYQLWLASLIDDGVPL